MTLRNHRLLGFGVATWIAFVGAGCMEGETQEESGGTEAEEVKVQGTPSTPAPAASALPPKELVAAQSPDHGQTSAPAESAESLVDASEPVAAAARAVELMALTAEWTRTELGAALASEAVLDGLPACMSYSANEEGTVENLVLTECAVGKATVSGTGTVDTTAYPAAEVALDLSAQSGNGKLGFGLVLSWSDVTTNLVPTVEVGTLAISGAGSKTVGTQEITVEEVTLSFTVQAAKQVGLHLNLEGLHILWTDTGATLDLGMELSLFQKKLSGTFAGVYQTVAGSFDVTDGEVAGDAAALHLEVTVAASKGESSMDIERFAVSFYTAGSFDGALTASFAAAGLEVTTLDGFVFSGDATEILLDGPVVMETLGQTLSGDAVAVAKRYEDAYPYGGELVLGYQTVPVLGWWYGIQETTQYAEHTAQDGWVLVHRHEDLVKPDGSLYSSRDSWLCRNLGSGESLAAEEGASCEQG